MSQLRKMKTGEWPVAVLNNRDFNHSQWNRQHRLPLTTQSNATARGYRKMKARQLLRLLNSGKLTGTAAAAVERDYAKELKQLRKGARDNT